MVSGDGVRWLLRGALARLSGLEPPAARVAVWRKRLSNEPARDLREAWAESLALAELPGAPDIAGFARRAGIEARTDARLEALVLGAADRFVCDGPSALEGAWVERALRR